DFAHGTGHGVGSYLSVHEGPHRISKGGDEPLRDGMIVSNEPGYYKAGDFGIRIENLQYVVPLADMLCFKTLTLVPIERRLIDPTMLAPDERVWLNAYHKRVAAEITPHLPDAATKRWLKRVCKNL
ncbi:MAG: M24 family metallopeptidase, partial [Alphaproteobacteria bacterium]|nr:M24 family metallopeptidase [Alphaproteobacteria bacterium]